MVNHHFLGIEVFYNLIAILCLISINDIFQRAGITDEETPLELNAKLTPTAGDPQPDPTIAK